MELTFIRVSLDGTMVAFAGLNGRNIWFKMPDDKAIAEKIVKLKEGDKFAITGLKRVERDNNPVQQLAALARNQKGAYEVAHADMLAKAALATYGF